MLVCVQTGLRHRFLRHGLLCIYIFTGNFRVWFCTDGTATTATETSDPSSGAGGVAHTKFVEMLCCRRKFLVGSDLETTYDSLSESDLVSNVLVIKQTRKV